MRTLRLFCRGVGVFLIVGTGFMLPVVAAMQTPPPPSNVRIVTDPSTLPLLQQTNLHYVGAFRVPAGASLDLGGDLAAYNPGNNSLFIDNANNQLGEISVPTPVNSTNITALPFATLLQSVADPTEGHLASDLSSISPAAIDGLLVANGQLYGTAEIYYDANNQQRYSHYYRSLSLTTTSFHGFFAVWQAAKTGFVSGWLASVPAEWQSSLGGSAITGQCCIPIVTRTSFGPSAFAFEPSALQLLTPAVPLLYYTQSGQLGVYDGQSNYWNGTTEMHGAALIGGTRTLLFYGKQGTGPYCYGDATSNQALGGTINPTDGEIYCYDPVIQTKAPHAYPYVLQMWAYDLNDLTAVRSGQKQPWDVRPYALWPITFPIPDQQFRPGAMTYDAANKRLFVLQRLIDQDGYAYRPLVHVFTIQ